MMRYFDHSNDNDFQKAGSRLSAGVGPGALSISVPAETSGRVEGKAPTNTIAFTLAKAFEDQVLGAFALVLLAPVMLVIALAVRLDSAGPVLFRQRRGGLGGVPFVCLKFRTMTVAEDGAEIRQATQGDARVTRVGGFLRRTSLDELPQLFNVLRGEMSLIGPRPHALAHDREYSACVPGYRGRHRVKPGITGLAQVTGCRGETTTVDAMRERIDADNRYVDTWNPILDFIIALRTPLAAFFSRKAY